MDGMELHLLDEGPGMVVKRDVMKDYQERVWAMRQEMIDKLLKQEEDGNNEGGMG